MTATIGIALSPVGAARMHADFNAQIQRAAVAVDRRMGALRELRQYANPSQTEMDELQRDIAHWQRVSRDLYRERDKFLTAWDAHRDAMEAGTHTPYGPRSIYDGPNSPLYDPRRPIFESDADRETYYGIFSEDTDAFCRTF